MTTNITFLVIGQILLSIGILGYFTNNLYLAFICVTFALLFFIRQLFALRPQPRQDTNQPPTITV